MNSEREKKENTELEEGEKEGVTEGTTGKGGHLPLEEVCPICLRSIGNTDCYVTKCGHKFHGSCMLNWCEIRRDTDKEEVCPMCRGQLKNNINFPEITKKILHNFIQTMKSHNVLDEPLGDFEPDVLWMRLPTGCQQELVETLEYHYFINEKAMYLGTEWGRVRERTRMPYNFSLSDLNFHI